RARGRVLLVQHAAAGPGLPLHQHRMARLGQLFDACRRHRDPVFAFLELLGHADDQPSFLPGGFCPSLARAAASESAASGNAMAAGPALAAAAATTAAARATGTPVAVDGVDLEQVGGAGLA